MSAPVIHLVHLAGGKGLRAGGGEPACVAQTIDVETFRHGFQTVLHCRYPDSDLEALFVTSAGLMDMAFQKGSDGSTFGGYPLACVAGVAALDVFEGEDLALSAECQGRKLRAAVERIAQRSPHVREVRGRGLFIGIEVKNRQAMDFCRRLVALGLIINDSRGHTIRVSPPLNITDGEIDFLVNRLEKVLL